MISFRNFALRRGERLLLSNVDLALHAGYRVGVVGRNGAGKSSLFAALMGEVEPDRGDIDLPGKARIASVAQETPHLPDPAIDFVLSGDAAVHAAIQAEANAFAAEDWEAVAAAHQRLEEVNGYDGTARAGRLLHGLGFPAEVHEKPVAEFSGGWRVRLNVARALMTPSDLLLLDEPTNHLDLDAVVWLEEWLKRYDGTLLVISHDREFLDNVTTHILHLHDGTAKLYVGNYTAFERQRAEHLRQQQIAFEKEQAERAHLQSFIDRFKAKASKARQAQSRMKRLEKLAGTEAVRVERGVSIQLPAPLRLPNSLLSLRDADCGYGAGATILRKVSFGLEAGDRIGLLGVNGAGKSTLVKTLVGELPPMSGERMAHPDLRIGYFAQHTVESLVAGTSPIDHLKELSPNTPTQEFRNFLGGWQFPGDRAFEVIDNFSGGEKARLALALLAWNKPNLLLLDEPTNHLDLEMREALAEALSDFDGAIVMVSHDRHLIGLVCDQYWRVHDGIVEPFAGDLDDYAAWLRSRPGSDNPKTPVPKAAPVAAAPPPPAVPKAKPNPHKVQKAEERVARLEGKLAECEAAMADPAIYADAGKVADLGRTQLQLRAELEAAEAELLALYEGA
ncbi:ABC-F family ATP-binding cassette domain-containing protein [Thermomonas haemolytica]|uniref:Probable ATP-binding protein YheS n=1 Tax=Thermomonas haemolytica TaxID=141949 RepID=A0A4R3N6M9_9GAMM|nr:ABC-F family ATP-binding cassette domain-containing protein [Thermomonas haemolytica]TCT24755.1 ATP-binding cassette subfamily F protein 3 [Thermomonas haemolytica]TNY28873.1 ABC transporter ATP-binding protein [Thermomonas haemolytica]